MTKEHCNNNPELADLRVMLAEQMARANKAEATLTERRAQFETTQRQLEDTSLELLRVRACCAEMRMLLLDAFRAVSMGHLWTVDTNKVAHALTTDCGQPILEKLRVLTKALEHYATCSDGCTCGDGWSHDIAIRALETAKKV